MLTRIGSIFTKEWVKKNGFLLAAYGGLILCLVIFTVLPPIVTGISIWSPGPLKSIIKHITVYALMSTGAVFIYSLGFMDISIGAQLSMYALFIMLSHRMTGSIWIGVGLSIVTAVICGVTNGAVAALLNMPSIITSLFLQFIIYGLNIMLIVKLGGGQFFSITIGGTWMEVFREPKVLVVIVVVVALIAGYIYNYTSIGKTAKAIGANETFVSQSGVNVIKYKVIMYLILGVCVVLAAVVYVGINGTADAKAGLGMEMKVMICLIMGGMPLKGGMKSKISSAILGSVTYTLMSDGLHYLRINASYINLFIGIIFVAVVLLTVRSKEKVLPR